MAKKSKEYRELNIGRRIDYNKTYYEQNKDKLKLYKKNAWDV